MTDFRAINGLLNSLLPFSEIASTSLRSEYVTFVSASVGRSRTRQSYLRIGAFDTVISCGSYPPRLAVAICG